MADYAYDHITEEGLPTHEERDGSATPTAESSAEAGSSSDKKDGSAEEGGNKSKHGRQNSLSAEFDQAYKTISASPWGARFGAIFENVKKQGEIYYDATKHEYNSRSNQATKSWNTVKDQIVTRSRALSTDAAEGDAEKKEVEGEKAEGERAEGDGERDAEKKEGEPSESEKKEAAVTLLARLRAEAMKGITEVQKAEDAADEYLAKWGTNLGNFLRDAVTIDPPIEEQEAAAKEGKEKELLFETKGGKDHKPIQ